MARPPNWLFFLSDNHARERDRAATATRSSARRRSTAIAAAGTRYANAYTASPLCCPARAAIATGRFPFQTGYWDNAIVYDGGVAELDARLARRGRRGRLGRQAPFPLDRRRQRLHRRARADAHPERQGRRQHAAPLVGRRAGERRPVGPLPRAVAGGREPLSGVRRRDLTARDRLAPAPRSAGRSPVGALRLVREPASAVHGAAGAARHLSRRDDAAAAALPPGRASRASGARAPAPDHGLPGDDRRGGAAADRRLLLRARHAPRREIGDGDARRGIARAPVATRAWCTRATTARRSARTACSASTPCSIPRRRSRS